MTGSVAIDVVLGLVFVYLLYSLLASLVQEIIATNLALRAKVLERAITRMLEDDRQRNPLLDRLVGILSLFSRRNAYTKDSLAEAFYSQPAIKYLGEDNWHRKPAYLKARQFSETLLQVFRERDLLKQGTADLIKKLKDLGLTGEETQKHLEQLWEKAEGDTQKFKTELETWFDDTMERATGWYKRYNQVFLFVIGLGIAIAFNVDSISIARKLAKDKNIREATVQQAIRFAEVDHDLIDFEQQRQQNIQQLLKGANDSLGEVLQKEYRQSKKVSDSLYTSMSAKQKKLDDVLQQERTEISGALGMGWEQIKRKKANGKVQSLWLPREYSFMRSWLGWLLTALALSLGAPFWYDVLSKVIKIRTSIATLDQQEKRS